MKRLLTALICLALVPGVASADTAALADPRVAYSNGLVIHTPEGAVIDLPDTAGELKLLGKSPKGWVVWEYVEDHAAQVWRNTLSTVTPSGTVTSFYVRATPFVFDPVYEEGDILEGYRWSYRLNHSGTLVAESFTNSEGGNSVRVVTLEGKRSPLQSSNSVLEFRGDRLVFSDAHTTKLWRHGHKPRTIVRRESAAADLRHDVLFVKAPPIHASRGSFGPTRITKPGKPQWTARFRPWRISPDGSRVAGYTTTAPVKLQIRRVRDGKVLTTFPGVWGWGGPSLNWEGNRAVLYVGGDPEQTAIFRCTMGQGCERATQWIPSPGVYSLPRAVTWS